MTSQPQDPILASNTKNEGITPGAIPNSIPLTDSVKTSKPNEHLKI